MSYQSYRRTINTIAWDLEGTLIENEDLHSDVLERTANAYDITPDNLNELSHSEAYRIMLEGTQWQNQ